MTYYKRNLPHWHPLSSAFFITWRLAGSIPHHIAAQLKNSTAPANRKFAKAESILDSGAFGPTWLRRPEIAAAVQNSIQKGALQLAQYNLLAYVVMPNHVHILIEPRIPLEKITQGIKGATAHFANSILHRAGQPFWQDESFDHWVRKPAEGEKIIRYIEMNPVKARLASKPSDWPWSSAKPLAQALSLCSDPASMPHAPAGINVNPGAGISVNPGKTYSKE